MNKLAPKLARGTYRHAKTGKLYEVIDLALQTETEEWLVVYRPLYENTLSELFARPYSMFVEIIELSGRTTPRFVKVNNE